MWNVITSLIGRRQPRMRVERRMLERPKKQFQAKISGLMGTIPVAGVDIHENGLGVRSRDAIAPGSVVFVHVKQLKLWGFAHVRHCVRHGLKFHLGLEFRGQPMRQQPGAWSFEQMNSSTAVTNRFSGAA